MNFVNMIGQTSNERERGREQVREKTAETFVLFKLIMQSLGGKVEVGAHYALLRTLPRNLIASKLLNGTIIRAHTICCNGTFISASCIFKEQRL